jgi:hypothetical protein
MSSPKNLEKEFFKWNKKTVSPDLDCRYQLIARFFNTNKSSGVGTEHL